MSLVMVGLMAGLNGCSGSEDGSEDFFSTLSEADIPALDTTVAHIGHADYWKMRHSEISILVEDNDYDLIFIGDSITENWQIIGEATWQRHYTDRNVINSGISGDVLDNMLWRIGNGELADQSPKVVVLLAGTNNIKSYPALDVAYGIAACVFAIRDAAPDAKVLLLGMLPREEFEDDDIRQKVLEANNHIRWLSDEEYIWYKDIGEVFLNDDGSIDAALMPDFLHPSEPGYALMAEALEPLIVELMGE